jgi:hypothetical protein
MVAAETYNRQNNLRSNSGGSKQSEFGRPACNTSGALSSAPLPGAQEAAVRMKVHQH